MKNDKTAEQLRNEGNTKFRSNKFYEALICYNKSLCNSTQQSANLGLAYANRSAVYLEMKQVDKCLQNIELARAHRYANEAKLNERQEKAKKLKENQSKDPKNDPANFFKLSYPPNEKYSSIVNCLEVHQNEEFGRYVVTNRALNPGDIIAIEEPIFKAIIQEARYERCSNCLKSNLLSLIPCDGYCTFGELKQIKTKISITNLTLFSDVLRSKMFERKPRSIPQV
jgi:SET and MYND domain-containing protein 4